VPNSPEIPDSLVAELSKHLVATFPRATLQPVRPGRSAALLFAQIFSTRSMDLHLSPADIQAAFERSYAAFKKLVLADVALRNVEPGFVFCISPGLPKIEQFTSFMKLTSIFCRKFVIEA